MTLPDERTRAIRNARNFLRSLLDPRQTPKVPAKVRRDAYWVLRHYPADYEIERLYDTTPNAVFGPLERDEV